MASIQSFLLKGSMHVAKTVVLASKQYKNLDKMRQSFERITVRLPIPANVHFRRFNLESMSVAWFKPLQGNNRNAMLFLHGGGYATGSINTAKPLIAKLVLETGISALAIDYRLAPEHPFPAALEDALSAYKYLLQQGYPPQNICIAGSSAGGGLTLATLLALKEAGLPMPATAVCLSPWTDLTGSGKSVKTNMRKDPLLIASLLPEWAARYAGNQPLDNPLISPLFGNLSNLPPIFLQVGTHEILLDDSVRFAQSARQQGADITLEIWDKMMHSWQLHWQLLPEANRAIANISSYLHQHMPVIRQ